MNTTIQLCDKYRPSSWDEVIGQDKISARIDILRPRGLSGRAYWISGPSGMGKTTIARILSAEVADNFFVDEIDAGGLSQGKLSEIEASMHLYASGKGGRAYIINEAHGLRRDIIRRLLVLLERIPSHVLFVFTTTLDGEESLFEDNIDAHPLLSRCIVLCLARRDIVKPAAIRLKEIAIAENLDGQELRKYELLLNTNKMNIRQCLQDIESGKMLG